ncbi:MAG: HAD family phosphatase [Anaerolineales bacterium]|nr:HAD family phosphatase [Anaerolineales bacterium]
MTSTLHITAVIFDMDGLMFDTERIAQMAWMRAAADCGFEFSDAVFRGVIGRALPDVKAYTRQAFGVDFPFEDVYRRKQEYIREEIAQNGFPLKEGLLDLLNWIERRSTYDALRMAVASSSPCETIKRNLRAAGLASERFSALVGGDEVQEGKPAPDIFLQASRLLGVPSERCLVLEDSNAGIQAAHAAGMIPVMIPDMIPPDERSLALAYRILSSLHEVKELIVL